MIKINLIPETMLRTAERRRRLRRWASLSAGAVGLLMIPIATESWRQAKASELRGESRRLTVELTALREEVKSLSAESEEVFLQIERAKALRSKRAWSAMLNLISEALPPTSWLTSVETDPPVPPPTAPISAERLPKGSASPTGPQTITIEAPRRLRISGYAANAAEPLSFVTGLNLTGVFQRVSLEKSLREPVNSESFFRFELVCEW